MKGQDAFERSLKQALEPYEVPYNSADWAQLEKRLDEEKGPAWSSSAALYALLLGGGMAVATTMQMLLTIPPVDPTGAGSPMVAMERTDGPFTRTDTGNGSAAFVDSGNSKTDGSITTLRPDPTDPVKAEVTADLGTTKKADRSSGAAVVTAKGTQTNSPNEGKIAPNTSEITIRPSVTEGCPGTTVEFVVENMHQTGMHLWNFGDGNFSNKPAPSHTFSKAGKYEVMLSHSSVGGGNIQNKPVSDLIVIHESPDAGFHAVKREFDNTVPSVHFENRSQGGKNYFWDFGDGTTSTIAHPDHVFKKKGTYSVALTVTNSNGCVDRTEQPVRISDDYDLLAIKTFSPNADGIEDLFIPEALKTMGVKFHMSIYDAKSGQLVYETSDHTRPWNGRVANRGEICSTGDYMWMVEMKDGDKLGGSYNGTISLVR